MQAMMMAILFSACVIQKSILYVQSIGDRPKTRSRYVIQILAALMPVTLCEEVSEKSINCHAKGRTYARLVANSDTTTVCAQTVKLEALRMIKNGIGKIRMSVSKFVQLTSSNSRPARTRPRQ